MDDQFDNDLKNRIREVFDNFEDPSADEGWLELRKKFPEEEANRRPFAWMWWGAAAALLLLFLGLGLWINNKPVPPEKFSIKKIKTIQPTNLANDKRHHDTIGKANTLNKRELAKTRADTIGKTNTLSKQELAKTRTYTIKLDRPEVNSNSAKTIAKLENRTQPALIPKLTLRDTAVKNNRITAKPIDTVKNAINNKLVVQKSPVTVQPNTTASSPVAIATQRPAKSIDSMFAENRVVKNRENREKVKSGEKAVHFGVYAATYFNYAHGSNNQVNLGVGVTSDIRISQNLKLITGITVAQNSLSFNTGVPTVSAQTSFDAPAASAYANVANTLASVPSFKNYSANLVGLDIPLNLKYEFNPQKNNLYVLAGVSSGTFINETYIYQYNYPALLSPSLRQGQNETLRRNFNGFYFAKTLNVAFGVGYPLGKNKLIFEPFLKYPLQGLGSQNIRFGAGGVNLKFNLESRKK